MFDSFYNSVKVYTVFQCSWFPNITKCLEYNCPLICCLFVEVVQVVFTAVEIKESGEMTSEDSIGTSTQQDAVRSIPRRAKMRTEPTFSVERCQQRSGIFRGTTCKFSNSIFSILFVFVIYFVVLFKIERYCEGSGKLFKKL